MTSRRLPTILAAVCACAALGVGCGSDDDDGRVSGAGTGTSTEAGPATTAPSPDEGASGDPVRADGSVPETETLATGLDIPWDIAFLPDGRALVTERPGRVRVVSAAGELDPEPLAEVDGVRAIGEGGLLGLAVDPDHEDNGFVYLMLTAQEGTRVERHRLTDDGRLVREAVVLDDIAAGPIHDAGRLRFGPDGDLTIPTGDAGDRSLPQDPRSRNGKILRLTAAQARGDGPADPEVVSSGHRNPQGLDWQPGTDRLVASEHGPDGDDEINVIAEGGDYGWPEVRGEDHGGFVAPIRVYAQSIAPSGATFVSRGGSPWTGDFLVAALVGEQLRRVSIDESGEVTGDEALFEGEFGRLRAVEEAPDGTIWALTSNTDGRGSPDDDDDRLLRILPPRG